MIFDPLPLTPSDTMLLIDFALAVALLFYFSLGRPRTWHRDRLGWVIFGYALSTVAFIGLIVYGISFGQKVAEPIRLLVSSTMAVALALKIAAVYRERREGRVAGARPEHTERKTMTIPTPRGDAAKSAIAKATEIWYKGQRVLRTLFTTVLTVLPLVPQVIAIVQGQWDAAWLGPVAAQAVAINTVLTGIIALPKVNAWLTKIGLGSVPKKAIAKETDTVTGRTEVFVVPDPKAETSV